MSQGPAPPGGLSRTAAETSRISALLPDFFYPPARSGSAALEWPARLRLMSEDTVRGPGEASGLQPAPTGAADGCVA